MQVFADYLKIIGRGQRAGRYLTLEEAQAAYTMVLNGQSTQAQLGAFLMLLRVREESHIELAGFVKAARAQVTREWQTLEVDLDLGGYAGKRRHLPWYVLSALCLAQHGYRVFMHSHAEGQSQRLYLDSVFSQLALPSALSASNAKQMLIQHGLVHAPLSAVLPSLATIMDMRDELGLRSSANTIARMLNPVKARVSFHGVHHRHFDERHVQTAQALGDLDVACIRGEGGEPEMNPERDCELFRCVSGEIGQVTVPAQLAQWQIKPREMQIADLRACWQGTYRSEYAFAAIIGSLTQYLMVLENMDYGQAQAKAHQMWAQRDRAHMGLCHGVGMAS
jgi:anthranilate phosphoribosyltransferase